MIKSIITDFSYVLLFPKNKGYKGTLNGLYTKILNTNQPYDFFEYYELNKPLYDFYSKISNDYPVYIFTSGIVQDDPAIKPILEKVFRNIFSSERLNLPKNNSSSFQQIAKFSHLSTDEILYIDDTIDIVSAAREVGIKAILYIRNDITIPIIEKILSTKPINRN